MIYLDSMKNIKNFEGKVSKVWCIVRSLKFPPRLNHAEIVQISDLSPSYDLFKKYLDLRNKKLWNQSSFNTIYKPQFLKELSENQNASKLLNILAKSDENILLLCFCEDKNTCHRSIIAEKLRELNIPYTLN